MTALFACMQAVIDDDEDDVIVKQFWYAFKQNFKQATVLWLFSLAAFAFLALYYLIVSNMAGMFGKVYRISFFVMCFLFLFGYQYLFPLQARYRNIVRNTMKNAWLLSIAAFPWTLLSIALVVGAVYISFFMNPAAVNTAVFLWGMVGFGLVAYMNSLIFQKAFKLIDPKKLEMERYEIPEEAIFIDEEHLPDDRSGDGIKR